MLILNLYYYQIITYWKNWYKYFVGYKNYDDEVTSLIIKFSILKRYMKSFQDTKDMTFIFEGLKYVE